MLPCVGSWVSFLCAFIILLRTLRRFEMKASVKSVFGGVLLLAAYAVFGQQVAAQTLDSTTAVGQVDSVLGGVSSTSVDPLNFEGNGTLVPDDIGQLYTDLIDYRNYNTAFLIKKGYSIKIDGRLNFGGAEQNDNDFDSNNDPVLLPYTNE